MKAWLNLYAEIPHGIGIRLIAKMLKADGCVDHAAILPSGRTCVVRQVQIATVDDYRDLATMLAEGPFDRAALVCRENEGSFLSDEIETWHIDDIEHLAARLAAETVA
jgi:hypothetical protein